MYKNITLSPVRAAAGDPLISTSRTKKPRSARSVFYSALMTTLGGDTGNAISEAFVSGSHEEFEKLMGKLANRMAATKKSD